MPYKKYSYNQVTVLQDGLARGLVFKVFHNAALLVQNSTIQYTLVGMYVHTYLNVCWSWLRRILDM